jgi:hypothetical protein
VEAADGAAGDEGPLGAGVAAYALTLLSGEPFSCRSIQPSLPKPDVSSSTCKVPAADARPAQAANASAMTARRTEEVLMNICLIP